jgi:hypothetical protein
VQAAQLNLHSIVDDIPTVEGNMQPDRTRIGITGIIAIFSRNQSRLPGPEDLIWNSHHSSLGYIHRHFTEIQELENFARHRFLGFDGAVQLCKVYMILWRGTNIFIDLLTSTNQSFFDKISCDIPDSKDLLAKVIKERLY